MTKAHLQYTTEHLLLIIFSHTFPLMAHSSAKLVGFLFLLTFFSAQIQARESQFFSKVPSSNGSNNVQETVTLPNKEEQSLGKQKQEPTFIPETENGYGLYAHENTMKYEPHTTPITSTATGSFEPYTTPTSSNDVKYEAYTTPITSTRTGTFEYNTPSKNTVNYEPYTTPTTSSTYMPYKTKTRTQENYNNYPNNNNKYYYNKDAFETQRENTGESKFQQSGYTNLANQNTYYNGYNNVEKQGMSDTRFLENGKYFHDVQNEKNYPNQYQQNSRVVVSGNGFNSRGHNANNENSYEYNNSMEGYENEEKEFDEVQN